MKVRNGVYYSDFRLSDGERIRRSLGTTRKAEAVKLERVLAAQMEAALAAPANAPVPSARPKLSGSTPPLSETSTITLAEAFKRAMKEHERWRASTSPKTITENFKHLSAYFSSTILLSELSMDAIFAYTASMDDAGLSASTINQRLSLLSVLFKCSRRWGKDMVHRPEIIRRTVTTGRKRVFTDAEKARILKEFNKGIRPKDLDMADLVMVLGDSGLRPSEALALADAKLAIPEATEIDFERRTMTVWDVNAKGKRSYAVPMTQRVHDILKRRCGTHQGVPFRGLTLFTADHYWSHMRKRVGMSHDAQFVIYALRHTVATRAAAATKGNAALVQRLMRHKSLTTTMGYVHLDVEDIRGLADALVTPQNGPEDVTK
jgi:integrase